MRRRPRAFKPTRKGRSEDLPFLFTAKLAWCLLRIESEVGDGDIMV